MPRRERPLESDASALLRFAADLRQLREKAGSPTYRELGRRAHYSATTLSEAAGGRELPSLAVTMAYVTACEGDPAEWQERWHAVAAEVAAGKAAPVPEHPDGPAPYVGLAPFQSDDADRFFGRERLVDELVDRVCARRFVGVFGASGSGKSSVLRAGLAARASTSGLSGGVPSPVVVFTPGPRPREECAVQLAHATGESAAALRTEFAADPENLHLRLRQAMAGRPPETDLLLIVDQFEELFTVCDDHEERAWFIAALVHAAGAATSRVRVVLGVRADFYGHCGQYPELLAALADGQLLVGAMSVDELRRAITLPAGRTGCIVESALVTQLVADAGSQPGVLPLVSHALLETWRRRRGATLTLAGYNAAGGIHHAIARSAENAYTALAPAQQVVARQIFLRLTALGDTTPDTKRRVSLRELDTDDPDTAVVLERLTQARLLTLDTGGVEIAHEAMIRAWPRLRNWLAEDREGLRIQRQLIDATDAWELVDRDPGALYRGTRLSLARDWARTGGSALTARERTFLEASAEAEAGERAAAARRTRRLRQAVALLSVLLLLATAAVAYAVYAGQQASEQRDVALTRKVLGDATAMRATNPALSLQLGLAAHRLGPSDETRDHLLSTLSAPYASRLTGHSGTVASAVFSPDGRTMATASWDRTARLWDLSDPLRPTELSTIKAHNGAFTRVALSSDGRMLATASEDRTVRLWDISDPRSPTALTSLTAFSDAVTGHTQSVDSVAFSPDSRVLATGSTDLTARLWDVSDPKRPVRLGMLTGHRGAVVSVAFSPDGRTLATGSTDRSVRIWDVSDPKRPTELAAIRDYVGEVNGVTFSPDGRTLATASDDKSSRLWDVSDPSKPALLATLGTDALYSAAFSADGRFLATGGKNCCAQVWDLRDIHHPVEVAALTGHTGDVFSVAFCPDGRTLATASRDSTVRLEDLTQLVFTGQTDTAYQAVFSPDGRTLATGGTDRITRLSDVTDPHNPRKISVLTGYPEPVRSVAFSPDGRILATAGDDNTTILWDVGTPNRPRQLATLAGHRAVILGLVFSPDGKTLATVGNDRALKVWDIADPANPIERGTTTTDDEDIVGLHGISPDGRVVATAMIDRTTRLWDISKVGALVELAGLPENIEELRFSPDGKTLATASADRTIKLWDLTDIRRPHVLSAFTGHAESVTALGFSPDGRTLATASADRSMKLWNVADLRRPHQTATLTGHTNTIHSVTFSPNGRTLATASADKTTRLWETDLDRVTDRICEIAYPRITPAEWNHYFPDLPYQPPCS